MKIGIAIRKDEKNWFVHNSYITYLTKKKHTVDIITLNTPLEDFDGFLIPGGNDLDPALYHQKNIASFGIDKEIDELDKKIILYAITKQKPLLGICRGIQSINVFLGGTLKQDIYNHSNENHFIKCQNKYYLVNSYHHQSIDNLAPDLEILALSIDGEIEIIKHKKLPIYGVQFHPELFSNNYNFFSEP